MRIDGGESGNGSRIAGLETLRETRRGLLLGEQPGDGGENGEGVAVTTLVLRLGGDVSAMNVENGLPWQG